MNCVQLTLYFIFAHVTNIKCDFNCRIPEEWGNWARYEPRGCGWSWARGINSACQRGVYQNDPTYNDQCCDCSAKYPGYWCPGNGSSLTPSECPTGKYVYTNYTSCTDTVCLVCTANMYCPSQGVRIQCPNNTVSLPGSINLMDCKCEAGSYTQENKCYACEAGTFSNISNATMCTACADGLYSTQRATGCTECPNNAIYIKGSTKCRAKPGFYSQMIEYASYIYDVSLMTKNLPFGFYVGFNGDSSTTTNNWNDNDLVGNQSRSNSMLSRRVFTTNNFFPAY